MAAILQLKGWLRQQNAKQYTENLTAKLQNSNQKSRVVYVIAWVRGQLRINFTRIFKVSQNCPSREATRAIWKTLKIQVKLILNCPRALAITCLSHKGQHSVQMKTFKVLPSRKQVCRLLLKKRLAVERAKHSKIHSLKAILLYK